MTSKKYIERFLIYCCEYSGEDMIQLNKNFIKLDRDMKQKDYVDDLIYMFLY